MVSLAAWVLVNSHCSLQGECVWSKNKACCTPSATVGQSTTPVDLLCVFICLAATPGFMIVACCPDSRMHTHMATSWFGVGASCRGPA